MRKKLIASDYDNTLRINGTVPEENRRAVDRWRQAGGLFGVVTGRGGAFAAELKRLDIPCDFVLCNSGALLLDGNGRVLRNKTMTAAAFERLEAAFAAHPLTKEYEKASGLKEYGQYSARMMSCAAAEAFAAELNRRFGDDVTAYVNGDNINITAKGEGKGKGVGEALKAFGLPPDAAAVVGDNLNDLGMIREHRGWAMAHGRADVIAAAAHTCTSVADLVDQLLNGEDQ